MILYLVNGPRVTSGPNGPELNESRLLQENGCPWELCFFKVLLKFCAEFNRKKTASKKMNFCRNKKSLKHNIVNIVFVYRHLVYFSLYFMGIRIANRTAELWS